ncbi:GDP-mannose 4,6-dehydratase [Actimicrobium sp. CCI2.3]|uniref:GDP-mannose 4,6-dehydratase n=1 Tax=Actimicrobium sp. CCI2.3 TaxID=3048616 RepID=UPI002AB42278|nr:GDP-mannose 4,6-dehydratase [Actimicrobium sp. CCI2.3]MDY7573975.1 GDP-mannose 4,6-dehydratase [Actimicrobium sp. CCI2.3]MEB0021917.1 GDP-mannose 4,6-dehydratase [Actimicrobium sp. CCI2.3]
MLKAFITGIDGFTGRYMAAELLGAGYDVSGLAHHPVSVPIPGVTQVYVGDLGDRAALARIVTEVQPDVVAHLAAIAFVAHGDAEAIYRTNLIGSRNLLEALSQEANAVQAVLVASSANVYGNATGGVLDETTPPAPANDYAVSKLAMEYMAKLYQERLPLMLVRPFNYTGVGQSESFLLPKIINHVRRRAPVIELGNLHVARDFSDVRTVVQYYRRLLETPAAIGNTFNVCSGQAHTLDEVLAMVRILAGYDVEVRVNPAFVRANEVKTLSGSRARLEAAVGVVPDIPLLETLRWMIQADV